MTPDDLRNVGEAAYGPRWQRELARDLSIGDRLVRRWVAGDRPMPADLADRLDAVVIARITVLVRTRRGLQQLRKKAA